MYVVSTANDTFTTFRDTNLDLGNIYTEVKWQKCNEGWYPFPAKVLTFPLSKSTGLIYYNIGTSFTANNCFHNFPQMRY